MRIRFVAEALLVGVVCWGCGGTDDTGQSQSPIGAGSGGVGAAGMAGFGAAAGTGAMAGMSGTPGAAGVGGMLPMAGTMGGMGMAGMTAPMAGTGGMGMAGMGMAGMGMAGEGGMAGMGMAGEGGMGGEGGMAGMGMAGEGGMGGAGGMGMGSGMCCDDGDCLCHGPAPTSLTSSRGPYNTDSYSISGVGCVYYPTDAEPPFAAVAISDGFLGSGGCGRTQTDGWGPLYASHGIVAMIVVTGSGDQPPQRGNALIRGIEAFKSENTKSSSPLYMKMSGRYGTSGFSMGGGGTSYASVDDPTLKTSVAIMPWGPVRSGVTVPTLVICGSSDTIASCSSHGTPLYNGIANSVPKMRVTVSSSHNGQPTAGSGRSGQYGLAFQKVFLENDQRWRPLLVAADSDATNIQ